MDSQKIVNQLVNSQVGAVLSQGFAQLYKNKPQFPISYLASWLKQHSIARKRKNILLTTRQQKLQMMVKIQKEKEDDLKVKSDKQKANIQSKQKQDQQFNYKITNTKHLSDLLQEWLPQYLQKTYQLTGAYVGNLDYRKKQLEQHNFQIGAQNDVQNPKVITYIGSSKSHQQIIKGKILPNQMGRSYDVFKQQQSQEAGQQGQEKKKNDKKSYLYIPNVLKDDKLFYFKYPRLGSFSCFPLKINSYLSVGTLQKGIIDYKAYLKNRQQLEKQYNEKVAEAKNQFDEISKKAEDYQVNLDDPNTVQQKNNLQTQAKNSQQKLRLLQVNPPIIEEVVFQTITKSFCIGVDTLGQDKQIHNQILESINLKIEHFKKQWERKQKQMLLADIQVALEEEQTIQSLENQYREHQKGVISSYEAQIKEQFANKQKQAQYQLSLIKTQKLRQFILEPSIMASLQAYTKYNIPKFTQIVQILCMLLGHLKEDINLPNSNRLNTRKIITAQSLKELLKELQTYDLKRQGSESVKPQFKINKLLERLEKIDQQALTKYNGFLFALCNVLKSYCWTRIYCRDAKIQKHQTKLKAKQERQNQRAKYDTNKQKALQTAKGQLDQEGQQNFKEEEWIKNYQAQNPKPQSLEVGELLLYLDID